MIFSNVYKIRKTRGLNTFSPMVVESYEELQTILSTCMITSKYDYWEVTDSKGNKLDVKHIVETRKK